VDIERWLDECEGAGLAARTRNKWRRILGVVFRRVAILTGDARLVQSIADTDPLPEEKLQPRCPPSQLVEAVLGLCADVAETCAVRLSAFGALRVGEVLGLRPEDWDRSRGVLQVVRHRDGMGFGPRKNSANGKPHCPVLDVETAHLVDQLSHLWIREKVCKARGASARRLLSAGWLLPWGTNRPSDLVARWRRASPVVRQWMAPGDSWHVFRHYAASACYDATKSEAAVMDLLGDSTGDATRAYMSVLRGTTGRGCEAAAGAYARARARIPKGETGDLFGGDESI